MLVGLKSSAFPYLGNNPRTEEPFLNIAKGERKGHRSYGGRVYWQDETYNDNRVLMHVPETFDAASRASSWCSSTATARRWNATCATGNWCRSRFRTPASMRCCWRRSSRSMPPIPAPASSGSPAASSASSRNRPTTSPVSAAIRASAKAFANMPIDHRRLQRRLHAGGLEPRGRRRSAIACAACSCSMRSMANSTSSRPGSPNNRTGFFVSAYTRSTRRHEQELIAMLKEKGIAIIGEYGRSAAARQRRVPRDARGRHTSRLRHARLDRPSRQGRAGQDGGNAGADAGSGKRACSIIRHGFSSPVNPSLSSQR